MSGRTLVIGDIHGCHIALDALLAMVEPKPEDHVIVLGDVVDRGPGSAQAIEHLLQLSRFCTVDAIMGNHEEMMLDAMEGSVVQSAWLRFGGRETLESYGGGFNMVPPEHLEFMSRMLAFLETESEICVHACLEPGIALEEQSGDVLRWERFTGEYPPWPSGQRIICGHTAQHSGVPLVSDGWVCIDTCCYGGQFLSCLDTASDLLYQARQSGEVRGPVPLAEVAIPV